MRREHGEKYSRHLRAIRAFEKFPRNTSAKADPAGRVRVSLYCGVLVVAFMAGCSARSYREAASLQVTPNARSGPSLNDLVPAQSLPARDEEVWAIEKPDAAATVGALEASLPPAGTGMLFNQRGDLLVPIPLEKTAVQADVRGAIASVDVRQRFNNASRAAGEIAYAFPLPQNGAVNEFVMSIGSRHIRGIVRERREAEQFYREAREQGFLASLMVQRSPNVFVHRVANVEAGKQIDIEIRYFHTLSYRDGWFDFVFPMIAGANGPGLSREVERSGRDVSVAVHLNCGAAIERVESPSHAVGVRFVGNAAADVSLEPADRIANRDFVVRYKLAGDEMKGSLFTEGDGDGGVFELLLVPPLTTAKIPRRPLEIVFDLDPEVGPLGNAAIVRILRCLSPADTFQIVHAVPGSTQALPGDPISATPENVARFADALSTLSSLGAPGSEVLRAALKQPHDMGRTRVVFLVSNGRGSLRDMLSVLPPSLGSARIVVVGVGPSPDRESIDAMAKLGRGAAIYLPEDESAMGRISTFVDALGHPAIVDLEMDWQGANISEVFPNPTADLLVGRAVILSGRYHGTPPQSLIVRGKLGNEARTWTVTRTDAPPFPGRSALACIWARRKIADLASGAAARSDSQLAQKIQQIALEYGLLSRYTAFISIDATTSTK